jgi:hypothetical protein
MNNTGVINIDEGVNFPNGFCISDNRIEDYLQRLISAQSYVVWRQFLRFWGKNKTTAYPSLKTLSERTGLSEKTIRECVEELVDKCFITKDGGNSISSNRYNYIPIENILLNYYGTTDPRKKEKNRIEDRRKKTTNVKKPLEKLNEKNRTFVEFLLFQFMEHYESKMGQNYDPDKKDIESLLNNVVKIRNQFDFLVELVGIFFKTRNKYIQESSYNLYFFLRPKTQNLLVAEYNQTDKGRWDSQARKIFEKIKPEIKKLNKEEGWPFILSDLNSIENWIRENVKFSGGNSDRDNHVFNYLVRAIKELTSYNN